MNECKLVEDFLPLYIDGALSEESEQFVRAHLAACSACREKEQALLSAARAVPASVPPAEGQPLARIRKKFTRKTLLISAIAVLVCAAIAFCALFFGLRARALYPASYRGEHAYTNADFEKTAMPALDITSAAIGSAVYVNDGTNNSAGEVRVRFELPAGMRQSEEAPNIFSGEGAGYISFAFETEAEAAWYYPNYELYTELHTRPARTYTELCRYVLEYDLGAVNVFSPMRDIRIACAVRELRAFVSVVNSAGAVGGYYPIEGDLNGFAVTAGSAWFICLEQERTLCHILIAAPAGVGASAETVSQFLSTVALSV